MPLCLLCPVLLPGDNVKPDGLRPAGATRHPPLKEASALLPSRKHPGVFWTLNDSGHPPHLFAIDSKGKLIAEYRVKATNLDWEALATDDEGNLYIGDIGNNFGVFSRRSVFRVREPEKLIPFESGQPLPELSVAQTYTVRYPDRPFDAEAMFFHRNSLYLLSKVKTGTRLYRLPLETTEAAITLVETALLPSKITLVTDACFAADGRRLAVTSYDYAAVLDLPARDPWEKLEDQAPAVQKFSRSALFEGCGWDGRELLLITEEGKLFHLSF
jgi:hypothetical protein